MQSHFKHSRVKFSHTVTILDSGAYVILEKCTCTPLLLWLETVKNAATRGPNPNNWGSDKGLDINAT